MKNTGRCRILKCLECFWKGVKQQSDNGENVNRAKIIVRQLWKPPQMHHLLSQPVIHELQLLYLLLLWAFNFAVCWYPPRFTLPLYGTTYVTLGLIYTCRLHSICHHCAWNAGNEQPCSRRAWQTICAAALCTPTGATAFDYVLWQACTLDCVNRGCRRRELPIYQ